MALRKIISAATTFLVVPGDCPERFEEAHRAGADVVIIDLGDAVPLPQKAVARERVAGWLHHHADAHTVVSLNPTDSDEFQRDAEFLGGLARAIMIYRMECAEDVRTVRASFGDIPLIASIGTAQGVLHAKEIALSIGVTRLAFGSADFSTEVGVRPDDHQAQLLARSSLVMASAAAHLAGPIEGITTNSQDELIARLNAEHVRTLGFAGKLCTHAKQVNAVRMAYAPTGDEIAWAKAVLAKAEAASVSTDDGVIVDKPFVVRAEQILAQVP